MALYPIWLQAKTLLLLGLLVARATTTTTTTTEPPPPCPEDLPAAPVVVDGYGASMKGCIGAQGHDASWQQQHHDVRPLQLAFQIDCGAAGGDLAAAARCAAVQCNACDPWLRSVLCHVADVSRRHGDGPARAAAPTQYRGRFANPPALERVAEEQRPYAGRVAASRPIPASGSLVVP